jgi:hypothetical protein
LARRWRVSEDKIRAWISNGELRAFNTAFSRSGRPRWLIDEADVAVFEQGRTATPPPRVTRRRRRTREVVNYF